MLTNFIKNLRKKPESSRAFFVWITTAIIMLIIIALWFNFSVKQGFLMNQTGQLKISSSSAKNLNKLSSFLKETKNNFIYFKEGLSKILGDFFAGKNGPQEIPPELKQSLPQQPGLPHSPVPLPKTD